MNNTFIGFLKSLINLAIIITIIVCGIILYEKMIIIMSTHIILYSLLYITLLGIFINWADRVIRQIFSRNYIDEEEIKQITKYASEILKEINDQESENSNVVQIYKEN